MNDAPNEGGLAPEQPRISLFGRRAKMRSPSESLQPQAAPPPPPPPVRKRRREGFRRLSGLLTFILIVALMGIGGFVFALIQAGKPGPLAADKTVEITREDDGGAIPDQLERAGIIESPLWFNLTLLLDGNRGKLKRGEYLFKAHLSLRETEDVLVGGKVLLHKVTVPEGLTSEQVVQRLRDNDVFVGDIKETPREGSILPETYEFERGVSRAKVLATMVAAQAKAVDEIWKKRAPDLPLKSPGELVTMASIVEKETGKADERPHVAGVFINRLQKRMKLESDPTIVYGLVGGKGTLGHSISKAELLQATAYNTYAIEGLPPGPICNPGKAAMEAVANPMRTADLFFVADGTGGHAFAETLDQHQKNVARWRQIEKDAKDKLAPDATPIGPPAKVHGEINPILLEALGAMASVAVPAPTPATGEIGRRLAHIGAFRQVQEIGPEPFETADLDASPEMAPAPSAAPVTSATAAPALNQALAFAASPGAAQEPQAAPPPPPNNARAPGAAPAAAANPRTAQTPAAAAAAPRIAPEPRPAAVASLQAAPQPRLAPASTRSLSPPAATIPRTAAAPASAPAPAPKAAAAPSPAAAESPQAAAAQPDAAPAPAAATAPAPSPFGGLASVAIARPPKGDAKLERRLAKLAADQKTREAMLGPNGILSASVTRASKSLADMGAVVQGVNDEQAIDTAAADEIAATAGPVQSYPMSAAALADQRSRAARYGAPAGEPAGAATGARMMASADVAATAASAARPHAFDASEGTALDPLLNKTYDLSYPKEVPVLK